jgi:hypothetical protein
MFLMQSTHGPAKDQLLPLRRRAPHFENLCTSGHWIMKTKDKIRVTAAEMKFIIAKAKYT